MKDAIELRPATQADYDFLYDLHVSTMRGYVEATWSWDEVWQRRHFQQHFRPEVNQIIVLNGCDAGLISVGQNKNEFFIRNIQILPEHQNKGIGRFIIARIIQQAQQQGCLVALQVLKVNRARRFYEQLGFVIEGETQTHFNMKWAHYS